MISGSSVMISGRPAYLPCQPMSTEEITRSLLGIDNRNAMLQELNKSFISKHEQVRLANLHEAEERLRECTRIVQLIEMKISVSVPVFYIYRYGRF